MRFLVIIFLVALPGHATTVEVSKVNGLFGFSQGYRDTVEGLKVGDKLIFSNGRTETVVKVLGSNTQTKVIEIENGHALRLPLRRMSETAETSVDQFYAGMEHLKYLAPEITTLKTYDYLPREYVEVELVEGIVYLSDFFRDWNANRAKDTLRFFAPEEFAIAQAKFWDFVKSTAHLVYVGDQDYTNIVYSKATGWIFLDLNDQHLLYSEVGWSRNIFTYLSVPPVLLRKVNQIVGRVRKPIPSCEEDLTDEDLRQIIQMRKYRSG